MRKLPRKGQVNNPLRVINAQDECHSKPRQESAGLVYEILQKMKASLGLVLIYSLADGIHFRVWIQNPAVGKNKCNGKQIDKEMVLRQTNTS